MYIYIYILVVLHLQFSNKDVVQNEPLLSRKLTLCCDPLMDSHHHLIEVKTDYNTCLDEADVFSVLPEALAAHVEPVFTDQTVSVRAYPAGMNEKKGLISIYLHEKGENMLVATRHSDKLQVRKFTLTELVIIWFF